MDIVGSLNKRRPVASWLLVAALTLYVFVCSILFVQWVGPSLDGRTDQHIAADSTTYMYMADDIREGQMEPWVLAALATFPNTFWVPVMLALILKSAALIVLANFAIFWMSIQLFKRTTDVSLALLLFFLLLNPTTTISLLSVNKEIVDLFVVALFCYSRSSGRKWALWFALIISLFNRYEVFLAMVLFLIAKSRANPWRKRRLLTLLLLVILLNFFLPLFASQSLSNRFEEASGAGLVAFLDSLEMHYLFALALIPKILENMFGELLNVSHWSAYTWDDPANSYILYFNNLASLVVLATLSWTRSFRLSSDWIYFSLIGAVLMSAALVNQPRYFYFCFVLFSFQAAQSQKISQRWPLNSISAGEAIAHR